MKCGQTSDYSLIKCDWREDYSLIKCDWNISHLGAQIVKCTIENILLLSFLLKN